VLRGKSRENNEKIILTAQVKYGKKPLQRFKGP
jgi:hypothetical protein